MHLKRNQEILAELGKRKDDIDQKMKEIDNSAFLKKYDPSDADQKQVKTALGKCKKWIEELDKEIVK